MGRTWVFLGSLNGFLAVAAGAFGAHALKKQLSPELLETFRTGAQYQMYHALGLLAVGWLATQGSPRADMAGWAMLTGIVLFSGSLYALALSGVTALGIITPFGGLAFLAGWALLAWGALSS